MDSMHGCIVTLGSPTVLLLVAVGGYTLVDTSGCGASGCSTTTAVSKLALATAAATWYAYTPAASRSTQSCAGLQKQHPVLLK